MRLDSITERMGAWESSPLIDLPVYMYRFSERERERESKRASKRAREASS